jgi:protein SCO1/2
MVRRRNKGTGSGCLISRRAAHAGVWSSALLFAPVLCAQLTSNEVPVQLRNVGIEQKLNKRVPLDIELRDETGAAVPLRKYFGSKPVILSFVYYGCPRLCSMQLTGMLKSLRALSFTAGEEFEVVNVSFDARETAALAAKKKNSYVEGYGRPGSESGWHFLTGEQGPVRRLTDSAGYKFDYDPRTDQFSHASAIMVLTPDGRLARYFYGIEYSTRDLRLALIEAADGKIGTAADQVLLYCFDYDPDTGRYSMSILKSIRIGGVGLLFAIVAFITISLRRERRLQQGRRAL